LLLETVDMVRVVNGGEL